MRRRLVIASVLVGVLVFLAISLMLARAFNAESAERASVTDLVKAEARGDAAGAIAQLANCAHHPACRARVGANIAALRHAGTLQVLQLEPSTGFSLTGTEGNARIAFRIGTGLPTVQCIQVRRDGNVVAGLSINLLAISRPLPGDAVCGTDAP